MFLYLINVSKSLLASPDRHERLQAGEQPSRLFSIEGKLQNIFIKLTIACNVLK